jgi:hypothetical protein
MLSSRNVAWLCITSCKMVALLSDLPSATSVAPPVAFSNGLCFSSCHFSVEELITASGSSIALITSIAAPTADPSPFDCAVVTSTVSPKPYLYYLQLKVNWSLPTTLVPQPWSCSSPPQSPASVIACWASS